MLADESSLAAISPWLFHDFTKKAITYVINEAAYGDSFGNPGMRSQLLQLVADIFINVLEGVEERGNYGGGSGAILDSGAQILFAGMHQSTIGVIDDHDFLGAQQVVRYDQGAQSIVRNDAACITDDVRVSRFQTQRANRKPGIHARQNRKLALRTRRQSAQFMRARIYFVCGDGFIDDAHDRHSLT